MTFILKNNVLIVIVNVIKYTNFPFYRAYSEEVIWNTQIFYKNV